MDAENTGSLPHGKHPVFFLITIFVYRKGFTAMYVL